MLRPAMLLLVINLVRPSDGLAQTPPASIYQDMADTVRILLIDAESQRTLPNAEVEIYSDNGTRCIRAPCPTEGRTWNGHSDGRGMVAVPASGLGEVSHIRTPAHEFFDLARARRDTVSGAWIVQLVASTVGVPPPDTANPG